MHYVTYHRAESGALTRAHAHVELSEENRAARYPHAEKLLGWPERTVFWTSTAGPALGVAPLK